MSGWWVFVIIILYETASTLVQALIEPRCAHRRWRCSYCGKIILHMDMPDVTTKRGKR